MSRFSGPQGKGALRKYRAETRARVTQRDRLWVAVDSRDWDEAEAILEDMGNPSYYYDIIERLKKLELDAILSILENKPPKETSTTP